LNSAFAKTIAQGMESVRAAAGELVTYWRGNDSVTAKAVPASTTFEMADTSGSPITFVSSDWIFKADELVIDGAVITPRRGDWVQLGALKYDVLSDGTQVYRYCDRGRTRIRVHTKERA
jgi:hypothetical protein